MTHLSIKLIFLVGFHR